MKLLAKAAADLQVATGWYEEIDPQLALRFVDAVEQTATRIERFQYLGRPLDATFRRMLVQDFPYAVIYAVEEREVVVYAVMHLSRHPDSWRSFP